MAHVGDHADDARGTPLIDLLADGLLARPQRAGECLVDDDNPLARRAIARCERAAGPESDPGRLEVAIGTQVVRLVYQH